MSSSKRKLLNLNFHQPVHFAGIMGSGMSGLARIVSSMGYCVVGTDPGATGGGSLFEDAEIPVFAEQDGRHIAAETQLIVASAALGADHPELVAARQKDIKVLSYAQMLGEVMGLRFGIAVAGTHGKTTTSAMIVSALQNLDESPGFVIGGALAGNKESAGDGAGDVFVAEACEYKKSFLNLRPRVAVVTNIELDHLDVYDTLDDIKKAFSEFVALLPRDGILIYSHDCPVSRDLFCGRAGKTISYGFDEGADLRGTRFRAHGECIEFNIDSAEGAIAFMRLRVPGRHNGANALAAFAVCQALGKSSDQSAQAVGKFAGVGRRFQVRGEHNGCVVVDDYAHHPTEIHALIEGARGRYPGRRLVVVFQPHQRSRTEAFFDGFVSSLATADFVVITDVFSAREGATTQDAALATKMTKCVKEMGTDSTHLSIDAVEEQVDTLVKHGDVLLIVGAGDVNKISDHIFQN